MKFLITFLMIFSLQADPDIKTDPALINLADSILIKNDSSLKKIQDSGLSVLLGEFTGAGQAVRTRQVTGVIDGQNYYEQREIVQIIHQKNKDQVVSNIEQVITETKNLKKKDIIGVIYKLEGGKENEREEEFIEFLPMGK
jgi:hypothetical protein